MSIQYQWKFIVGLDGNKTVTVIAGTYIEALDRARRELLPNDQRPLSTCDFCLIGRTQIMNGHKVLDLEPER